MTRLIKFLLTLSLLPLSIAWGQTTTITATVVDSDGTVWANAPYTLSFRVNPSQPNQNVYNIGGVSLNPALLQYSGYTNGSGVLSQAVYQNTAISPSGSQWTLQICPLSSAGTCGAANFSASGSTMNVSTAINAAITAPRFPALAGAYGYTDIEAQITLPVGATYWNVTLQSQRYWNGSTWVNSNLPAGVSCTGSGTSQICTFPGTVAAGTTVAQTATLNVPTSDGPWTQTFQTADLDINQGYATDGTYNYLFFGGSGTGILEKADSTYYTGPGAGVITQNSNTLLGLTGANHMGDGEVYNNLIYAPIENYNGCPTSNEYIAVFSATTTGLPLVNSRDISADNHEISSIAVVPSTNSLYVTSYCDGSKLWIYDLTSLTLTGTLTLSQSIKYLQGITYNAASNSFYVTADDTPNLIGGSIYQISMTGAVTYAYNVPVLGEVEGLDYATSTLRYVAGGAVTYLAPLTALAGGGIGETYSTPSGTSHGRISYDRYNFNSSGNIYYFNNDWWTDDPTIPSTYVDQNYIRGTINEQACPAPGTSGTAAPTLLTSAQLAACNTLTVTPTGTASTTPITAADATSAHQLMAMGQVPIQNSQVMLASYWGAGPNIDTLYTFGWYGSHTFAGTLPVAFSTRNAVLHVLPAAMNAGGGQSMTTQILIPVGDQNGTFYMRTSSGAGTWNPWITEGAQAILGAFATPPATGYGSTTPAPVAESYAIGSGTATYTWGVGAGTTGATGVSCGTGFSCDSHSGQGSFTTTAAPTASGAILVTITLGGVVRPKNALCWFNLITAAGIPVPGMWTGNSTTTTLVVNNFGAPLSATTGYDFQYSCN